MKFNVTITFEVESSDYHGVKPTKESVRELAEDMLAREADLPESVSVVVREKKGKK